MDYRPLLAQFSRLLTQAKSSGIITNEHLETTNKTVLNETHSFVLTFLIEAALHSRGTEFEALAVEHSLKAKEVGVFRPDLTLWKVGQAERSLVGVLEYESPNSGDERIWRKDIEYFHNFIRNPIDPLNTPSGWIIITTLPDHTVSRSEWKNWDYNKSDPEYAEMILNPFQFWYQKYADRFNQHGSCCFEKCFLSLANLTDQGLQIHLTSDSKLKGAVWKF